MDRTKTEHNGGIPFFKNQERFDLNAIRDAINALAESLVGGKAIKVMARLYGVVVSEDANFVYVTAGAVIINGEIRKVDAQSIAKNANKVYVWNEYTFSPVEERKNDLNGNPFDLFEYRRARLIELADDDANLSDYILHNKLKDLNGIQSDWIDVAAGGGGSDWSLTSLDHCRYFKDINGNVHLDFHVTWDVAGTVLSLFTLPAGHRPSKLIKVPIYGGYVNIQINGEVDLIVTAEPDYGFGYTIFRADL